VKIKQNSTEQVESHHTVIHRTGSLTLIPMTGRDIHFDITKYRKLTEPARRMITLFSCPVDLAGQVGAARATRLLCPEAPLSQVRTRALPITRSFTASARTHAHSERNTHARTSTQSATRTHEHSERNTHARARTQSATRTHARALRAQHARTRTLSATRTHEHSERSAHTRTSTQSAARTHAVELRAQHARTHAHSERNTHAQNFANQRRALPSKAKTSQLLQRVTMFLLLTAERLNKKAGPPALALTKQYYKTGLSRVSHVRQSWRRRPAVRPVSSCLGGGLTRSWNVPARGCVREFRPGWAERGLRGASAATAPARAATSHGSSLVSSRRPSSNRLVFPRSRPPRRQ